MDNHIEVRWSPCRCPSVGPARLGVCLGLRGCPTGSRWPLPSSLDKLSLVEHREDLSKRGGTV